MCRFDNLAKLRQRITSLNNICNKINDIYNIYFTPNQILHFYHIFLWWQLGNIFAQVHKIKVSVHMWIRLYSNKSVIQ